MAALRHLFVEAGLLGSTERDALHIPGADPWHLRSKSLTRLLSPHEFAIALGHLARHRGFKSNSKGAQRNEVDDKKKMLKASAETRERLALYPTPARMLTEDPGFVLRQTAKRDGSSDVVRRYRNRDGDYSRSLLRDDLEAETRKIFDAQRRLGQALATDVLEAAFVKLAFTQRPLQDSEAMIGTCPFETAEKRSPRRGYSFELFRYLARLNSLSIVEGRISRRLTADEIGKAEADFGATASITFAALRKKLSLGPNVSFDGIKGEEESKKDVVSRSGGAATGTWQLRKLIAGAHGEMAWRSLLDRPALLDAIAATISFRDDLGSIGRGLAQIGLPSEIQQTLQDAAARGDLDAFTRAGHISAKAARSIIPGLRQGITYDKACAAVGYDHTASRERHAFDVGVTGKEALARILKQERISRDLVGSPVARKALHRSRQAGQGDRRGAWHP